MEEEQQRASQGETGESAAGGTSGSAKAMANGSSVEGFKKAKAADTGPAMDPKSHLDKDGKPLHLADNSKGLVGPNKWMWENAKLIFGSEEERKSSKCLGAWCLKCEEAGKSPKECYLNYHPTRNFKAISRHFKRIHADLSTGVGASQSSQKSDKKRSTGSITLLSNRSPSSLPQSKRAKITRDSSQNAKEAVARIRLSVDEKKSLGHRMISHPTFHPCGEGRLVVVTEHMLSVPLYRSRANQPGSIDIYFTIIEKSSPAQETFFRALGELSPVQRAAEYVNEAGLENADDMMIFLQGGPGFGAPVANVSLGLEKHTSWAASALDHYSRVVLMDQRGTGRSGLITKQTLTMLFPNLFLLDHYVNTMFMSFDELNNSHPEEVQKVKVAVAEASDFLSQFRADSIVLDAEDIKDALLLRSTSKNARPWGCALGQSFGGFCIMSYLSKIPGPPKVCLFTGGVAPMLTSAYDVYRSLWNKVKERNLRYYDMYPGDIGIVKKIVEALLEEPAPLPSGGLLTARRFLQLGLDLGGSPSSFAKFHDMLSNAFLDSSAEGEGEDLDFKRSFLKLMDSAQSFDDNPLYFWLHESIYADGPENSPTDWAAHRAFEDVLKESKDFDYRYTSSLTDDSQPTLFFGEMMFPWMPQDYEELSGVGLQAVANDLASKKDWGKLYDADQMRRVLEDGTCKAAAAVYYEDMYVDFDACTKVTARGGPLEKCKLWVTNEYQHSGIRDDGAKIFGKLHNMALGSLRLPS